MRSHHKPHTLALVEGSKFIPKGASEFGYLCLEQPYFFKQKRMACNFYSYIFLRYRRLIASWPDFFQQMIN